MWVFLGLVLGASSDNFIEDGLVCIQGTWVIEKSECRWFLNGKQITAVIRRYSSSTFFLDVNPSRWSRKNLYYLELGNAENGTFTIFNNRHVELANVTAAFARSCSIDVVNETLGGVTASLSSRAGAGTLFVTNSKNETCTLPLAKQIRYESWRFSLTIFLGILAMFIGFAGYFGWTKEDLTVPRVLPIDNPGEEYDHVEAATQPEEEDEFDSDDGY